MRQYVLVILKTGPKNKSAGPQRDGRINYCHMKDWKPFEESWLACAPGDDDLDYRSLLPIPGYTGVYLIEYEPLEDTLDGIHRRLSYFRRIVPNATLGK